MIQRNVGRGLLDIGGLMDKKYKIKVVCTNCFENSDIEVKYGKRVETVDCPHCGVKACQKSLFYCPECKRWR
jgi:hypothetical protein